MLGFRLAILQIQDWHINANIMLRVFSEGFISNDNKLVSRYFKCLKLSCCYPTLIDSEKHISILVFIPISDLEVEYSSFCTVAVLLWGWKSAKSLGAESSKAKNIEWQQDSLNIKLERIEDFTSQHFILNYTVSVDLHRSKFLVQPLVLLHCGSPLDCRLLICSCFSCGKDSQT